MQGVAAAHAVVVPDYTHELVSSLSGAVDSKADADAGWGKGCEPGTLELMNGYGLEAGFGR